MYKKDRIRRAALYLCCILALGICLALIGYFVYILRLRTEYRAFCMEINDAILATEPEEALVRRGDGEWPADRDLLDYYDIQLRDAKTVVFNRKAAEPDEKSIYLILHDGILCYTGMEDGSAVNLRWETDAGLRAYTVRSDNISFMQLSAYLSNYARRLEQ